MSTKPAHDFRASVAGVRHEDGPELRNVFTSREHAVGFAFRTRENARRTSTVFRCLTLPVARKNYGNDKHVREFRHFGRREITAISFRNSSATYARTVRLSACFVTLIGRDSRTKNVGFSPTSLTATCLIVTRVVEPKRLTLRQSRRR